MFLRASISPDWSHLLFDFSCTHTVLAQLIISQDLGLELNTDPDDPSRDTSKDDEDME